MPRCQYVDPKLNLSCGKNTTLAKIVINIPNQETPIVKWVCRIHGDSRFNYLAQTEIELTKQKDQQKISYTEFAKDLKIVRWNRCRRCNGDFEDFDIVCTLEYYWLKETRISMRRAFLLHNDCLDSELKLYSKIIIGKSVNQTLDFT